MPISKQNNDLVVKLRRSYRIALGLLALLILSFLVISNLLIKAQSFDAQTLNIAGRQRMLSQRMAKLAMFVGYEKDSLKRVSYAQRLDSATIVWNRVHWALQDGDPTLKMPKTKLSPEAIALFKLINPSQQKIAESGVAILVALKDRDEAVVKLHLQTILINEPTFLKLMDKIVNLFEAESKGRLQTMNYTIFGISLLAMIVLFLEGILIFRPMSFNLSRNLTIIDEKEQLLKNQAGKLQEQYDELQAVHEELQSNEEELKQTLEYTLELKEEIEARESDLHEAQAISKVGSFRIALDGSFVFLSEMAKINLGYGPHDFVTAQNFGVNIPKEDFEVVLKEWNEGSKKKEPVSIDFRVFTPEGNEQFMHMEAKPERNGEAITHYVGFIQDVSKQVLLNKSIVESSQRAEAAVQARNHFLSTMTHEIRTPMNAVVGFTNLLLIENPREDQKDNLQTLLYSANHLLSLLNDVLDYAKIESGHLNFEYIQMDVEEQLQSLLRLFHLKAEEKHLFLKVDSTNSLSVKLLGDQVRFVQVMANLIGNALKFTEAGGITFGYQVMNETPTHIRLRFFVKDTGIGIPAEKHELIFEPFKQAASDTTRKYGGTGLGLAISKKIVEMQGGKLWLESAPGNGSSFMFELTFEKGKNIENRLNPKDEYRAEDFHLKGLKILLVDDNEINLLIASKFLSRWEAIVETAPDGLIAVEKAKLKDYDIILMDIQMPNMDGYEATKTIRKIEHPTRKNVPILALTASVTLDVQEEVKRQGMNGFVTKPFVPQELLSAITYEVSRREQ